MTGRIKIIRKTTSVVDGRRQQEEKEFLHHNDSPV